MSDMKTTTDRRCPECGRVLIPIHYGYPSPSMFEASDAGLIRLGGCLVDEANPLWWCENDRVPVYLED